MRVALEIVLSEDERSELLLRPAEVLSGILDAPILEVTHEPICHPLRRTL